VAALKQLPQAELPAGFEQRVFAAVRKRYAGQTARNDAGWLQRFGFTTGFATAAVAGLAIWVVTSLYQPMNVPGDDQAVVSIALHDTQTVRLLFDADTAIEKVDLRLDIPDHIELAGYPGYRELSWQTRLDKGQNVLALPIQVVQQGQGELVAHLHYGDTQKTLRVLLKTSLDGVMRMPAQGINAA
jgi:hypothetical protein